MRLPGIEPGSRRWQRPIITTRPQTLVSKGVQGLCDVCNCRNSLRGVSTRKNWNDTEKISMAPAQG